MEFRICQSRFLTSLLMLCLAISGCGQSAASPAPPTATAIPTRTMAPSPRVTASAPELGPAQKDQITLKDIHGPALPQGAIARLGKGTVNQIALSPETDRIAVATSIGVYVFRLGTDGHSLEELWFGPTLEPLHSVAFSPDGALLATGSEGSYEGSNRVPLCDPIHLERPVGVISIWNAQTGESLRDFAGGCTITHLAFSSTGKKLAFSGECFDDMLGPVILDLETGKQQKLLSGIGGDIHPLLAAQALSPDGSLLAAAYTIRTHNYPYDVRIMVFLTGDGTAAQDFVMTTAQDFVIPKADTAALAFSPDSHLLAIGTDTGAVFIRNADGDQVAQFSAASTAIRSLAFSPSGRSLAVLTDSGGSVISTADWTYSLILAGHGGHTLAFSTRDASLLTASSTGGPVVRWDLTDGGPLHTYDLEKTFQPMRISEFVQYSPDGRWLAASEHMGGITLWNAADLSPVRTFSLRDDYRIRLTFSPDSTRLAGSAMGTILEWDIATGAVLRSLEGSQPAYGPTGKIVGLMRDNTIVILDPQTGVEIASVPSDFGSLAVSPDGRFLAYSLDKGLAVWDVARRKEIKSWENDNYGGRLVFAPDGSTLAWTSREDELLLYTVDAPTDPVTPELNALYSQTRDAAFSPDGKLGALVSGNITLWNRATGRQVAELTGHSCQASSASFSPDGKRLATSSYDETILVWDVAEIQRVYAEETPD